jgi:hypothetical protein
LGKSKGRKIERENYSFIQMISNFFDNKNSKILRIFFKENTFIDEKLVGGLWG